LARRHALGAILLAVVAGALVVAIVVLRDADRREARITFGAGPRDPVEPFTLKRAVTRFRIEPASIQGRGLLSDQIGTYLQPPRDTITFTVLDARGSRVARCVYPPDTYVDNTHLICPLPDIARARTLVVSRSGTAKTALIAHGNSSGYLAVDEDPTLGGRVRTVLSRIATSFPNGVGSTVLIVGVFASVALSVLALMLAVGQPRATLAEAAGEDRDGREDADEQ
jgi:hypothetical protein